MGRHAIHLGAAWETVQAEGTQRTPWRRWFHRPTGLTAGDRLLLIWERVAGLPAAARLTLNGTDLPPAAPVVAHPPAGDWEFDVTDLVDDRNELLLRIDADVAVVATTRMTLPDRWGRLSLVIVSD